jgi:hypothetical protein
MTVIVDSWRIGTPKGGQACISMNVQCAKDGRDDRRMTNDLVETSIMRGVFLRQSVSGRLSLFEIEVRERLCEDVAWLCNAGEA